MSKFFQKLPHHLEKRGHKELSTGVLSFLISYKGEDESLLYNKI